MPDIFKVGRILAVAPAELGKMFESACTVTVMVSKDPSPETNWRRVRVPERRQMFWYDLDKTTNQQVFCTYSGYFDRIFTELSKLPVPLNVTTRLSHKLPAPDLTKLAGVQWRPRQAEVFSKLLAFDGGVIVCPTAFGKCLGKGTPVMMFDGTVKPVESVVEGDQLMGPDSKPRNVLSTCSGVEALYRVIPSKGDAYVVNESHILSLKMTAGNSIGYGDKEIVDISVLDYLKETKTFRHCAKGWRTPIDFPHASGDMRIPPYMFGVWLGDGASHEFAITTMDKEIEAEVEMFAKVNGLFITRTNNGSRSDTLHVIARPRSIKQSDNDWIPRNHLKSLGVYKNKHIPLQYKTASTQDRLELLAGIMDTDGYYNKGGVYELTLISEKLLDDVIFVARSLGFSAYKCKKRKQCCNNGVWGTYFSCVIGGPVHSIPCRIPYKRAVRFDRRKDCLLVGIRVERIGVGEYFGFEIDGDRRFLLGDFTVTHNTFLIRQLSRVYPTSKIVVTVSSLDIAKTLFGELKDHINDLGFCGTGGQHPRRVTVAVTNSLDNCDPDAQLLLVDECHSALAPSVIKRINRFRRAKLFGFTASPEGRSDGGDGFMEAIFGSQLCDVTYQESVQSGNIVQLRVKMYKSPNGPNLKGIDDKNYVDRAGIIRNAPRNDLVARATRELEKELGDDAQILVMVDKIEHAYILSSLLPEYTVVTGVLPQDRKEELERMKVLTPGQKLCSAKDRDAYRRAFESNQLKRVIATRIWEKGVDFRDLLGLVRADGLASSIAACQIPGRLSRLGKTVEKQLGVLVDFYDMFSDGLKGRARKRLKSYRDSGWVIENHV